MFKIRMKRILRNFIFLAAIFLIESIVISIFYFTALEYLEVFEGNHTIMLSSMYLVSPFLIVFYKIIFEAWLIYSVALVSTWKNKKIITKKTLLLSRKKTGLLVASIITAISVIAALLQEEKVFLVVAFILGIIVFYAVPIIISCLIGMKYLKNNPESEHQ